MDCSLQGSSVHEIFQARILEWVAISNSEGSSWPRERTRISCIGRWILYHWATREAHISTRRPFWEETGPAVGCLSLRQIITHTGSRCHTKEQIWPLYSGAGDSRGDWRGNFAAGSFTWTPVLRYHNYVCFLRWSLRPGKRLGAGGT